MATGKTVEEEVTELMLVVDRAIEVAASRNELQLQLKGPNGEFTRAYAQLRRSTKVPDLVVARLREAGYSASIMPDFGNMDDSYLRVEWSDA